MKRPTSAIVAVVALLLPGAMAGQNKLVNGSFENPGRPFPGVTLPAGSTFITGWTVSRCNIDYGGLGWLSADGAYSLDLNGNNDGGNCAIGGIRQDVAGLTPGARYDLSFAMAGNPGPSLLDKTLVVLWGTVGGPAQSFAFTFLQDGWTLSDMGWTRMSQPALVASAPAMRLEFRSTTPLDPPPGYVGPALCCTGPTLDDVSLVSASTAAPEPETVPLLAVGVGAIWLLSRRRRVTPQRSAGVAQTENVADPRLE